MAKKTIIHLSDLHIGRGMNETNLTTTIVNKIKEDYEGAHVLITGDLTNAASKKQYLDTSHLLEELLGKNPVLMVPGNHDCSWGAFGSYYSPIARSNWLKYLGPPSKWCGSGLQWQDKAVDGLHVWEDGPIVYFGIDSCKKKSWWNGYILNGFISDKLANALKASLKEYAEKTRIVFLHHHPITKAPDFIALDGDDRLLEALTDNCELLLCGHMHSYEDWQDYQGIPLIISSHKSTDIINGKVRIITIDVLEPGTDNVSFDHRKLEL